MLGFTKRYFLRLIVLISSMNVVKVKIKLKSWNGSSMSHWILHPILEDAVVFMN